MANAATWKRRLAEWRASGLTAAEFAAGREYAASTLTWWSWRLGRVDGSGPAQVRPASALAASAPAAPAAPPARSPHNPALRGGAPEAAAALLLARVIRVPAEAEVPIVLEHASVRVIVHRGFERATLLDVLDALDARGARS